MKIVMVMENRNVIGGFACYHPEHLARELRSEGHDVQVVFSSCMFEARGSRDRYQAREVPTYEVVERIMSANPDLVMFERYAETRIVKSERFKIPRERTLSLYVEDGGGCGWGSLVLNHGDRVFSLGQAIGRLLWITREIQKAFEAGKVTSV